MLYWQAKLAAALLFLAGLFFAYDYVGDRAVDKYKTEQAIVQAAADKAQQEKYNNLAADYEVAKASKEIVYRTIPKKVDKIVERKVYSNECFDLEGLEEANKALRGKNE